MNKNDVILYNRLQKIIMLRLKQGIDTNTIAQLICSYTGIDPLKALTWVRFTEELYHKRLKILKPIGLTFLWIFSGILGVQFIQFLGFMDPLLAPAKFWTVFGWYGLLFSIIFLIDKSRISRFYL